MPNRITLAQVRPDVASALNMCSDDARIPSYVNAAQRRLLVKGKWVGSMVTYRTCVSTDSCIVWPRQIEAIEAWSLCDTPGVVRNRWYQFTTQGPGQLTPDDNWFTVLIDRDPVCAFDEIGTDSITKKIQVSTVVPESAGAEILLQGYDENRQWIRTLHNGVYVDGEYCGIGAVPTLTTSFFTKLVGVQKPITNGLVILSEYETAGGLGVVKTLAQYENDETSPIYKASFLPGIANQHGCDNSDSDCTSNQVTILAKLKHIDVRNDIDWLVLTSPDAIVSMCMAVFKERNNLFGEAKAYEADAVRMLQEELTANMGDGELPTINRESPGSWGGGVIPPLGYWWPTWY